MRTTAFSEADLRAIAHDRYHHPDPRAQQKREVLWLKSHGLPHDHIATYAGVSRRTVQRYLHGYRTGGLEGVRRRRWKPPAGALVEHEASPEAYVWEHPPRPAKHAQAIIEQQTGIRRGLTQVRHFLNDRLALRRRKVGAVPVPPKKTAAEHARVVVRLFVRAASGRRRYNVLGALNAVTHRLIRVTNQEYISAESVCELLRAIAAVGRGSPITLVLDSARHRRCDCVRGVAGSLGIERLYLPSDAPNRNRSERLWRFVRKPSLDATYDETVEGFRTAIDRCLEGLPTTYRKEMEALMVHRFQTFEDVPLLAA